MMLMFHDVGCGIVVHVRLGARRQSLTSPKFIAADGDNRSVDVALAIATCHTSDDAVAVAPC